jgi:hypothetical protein
MKGGVVGTGWSGSGSSGAEALWWQWQRENQWEQASPSSSGVVRDESWHGATAGFRNWNAQLLIQRRGERNHLGCSRQVMWLWLWLSAVKADPVRKKGRSQSSLSQSKASSPFLTWLCSPAKEIIGSIKFCRTNYFRALWFFIRKNHFSRNSFVISN